MFHSNRSAVYLFFFLGFILSPPMVFSQRGPVTKNAKKQVVQKNGKNVPVTETDTVHSIKVKRKPVEEKVLPKIDSVKTNSYSFITMSNGRYGSVPGKVLCELNYGYQHVSTAALEKSIFEGHGSFSFGHIIYGAGLNIDFNLKGSMNVMSLFSFTRINPEKVSSSDSSSWTLSGFSCHLINFGFNFFPYSTHVEFVPYLGFEYGRLKLNYEEKDQRSYFYKNPYFAFHLMADLRYRIYTRKSFIAIGGRAGCFYDPGNPRWIGVSGGGPGLPGTKMKGYYYSILLCLPLN